MIGPFIPAVPKHGKLGEGFNRAERLKADEHPGRPAGRLAGGWIDDLVASKKFVILCPFCVSKFNPRSNQYEPWRDKVSCIGRCDGCKQHNAYLKGFIHQGYHDELGQPEVPRRGRWFRKGYR